MFCLSQPVCAVIVDVQVRGSLGLVQRAGMNVNGGVPHRAGLCLLTFASSLEPYSKSLISP